MRRTRTWTAAAVLPLALLAPLPAAAASHPAAHHTDASRCAPLPVSAPAGARIESTAAVARSGGDVTFPSQPGLPADPPVTDMPAYCEVTVTVTHPGDGDHEHVRILLPEDRDRWNGRFQAVGGSAFSAGDFGAALGKAAKAGYAAASTDAGVTLDPLTPSAWALKPDGTVNQPLLRDFASRGVHDMAVVGKDVTKKFYDRAVDYAYFDGCSTGGRQGYAEAQQYPTDFQGIVAAAPALDWDSFAVGTLWPQVVMNEEHTFPTTCEFDAFNAAAVKACDTLDGVADGVIGDPGRCDYDPRRLVGTTVACDGKQMTITAADADVVRRIWQGPTTPKGTRLWYGLPVGADFGGLARTATDTDGTTAGAPFIVAQAWVRYFLERDPGFDTRSLTYAGFARLLSRSRAEFDKVIGTDDPDLSAFRRAGGKLLTWQGTADQLITPQGTVAYREQVDRRMGGTKRVDDFYRLFLAPGANHCGIGSTVPVPTDPLAATVAWVEHGKAPATLPALGTDGATRDLCRFPQVPQYAGHGDPASAGSYRCARG